MGRMVALVTAAALTAGCSGAPPVEPEAAAPAPPAATRTLSTAPALHAFPRPRDLGAGWSYRVDPGDAEAGYDGTGTPSLPRDPAEVAMLAVPLGCPRTTELPVPSRVTEVGYAYRDRTVVALRMVFAGERAARSFLRIRLETLAACVGISGGPAVGPYVTRVHESLNDRTPESDPWTEAAVRRGAAVLLVAASGPFAGQPLDPARLRKLVRGA